MYSKDNTLAPLEVKTVVHPNFRFTFSTYTFVFPMFYSILATLRNSAAHHAPLIFRGGSLKIEELFKHGLQEAERMKK